MRDTTITDRVGKVTLNVPKSTLVKIRGLAPDQAAQERFYQLAIGLALEAIPAHDRGAAIIVREKNGNESELVFRE